MANIVLTVKFVLHRFLCDFFHGSDDFPKCLAV